MNKMSIGTKFEQVKERQNNRQLAGVRPSSAFTIVELLIVIVIIGILAAITIVSYSGLTQKATTATLQSDLTNASKKLNMYYALYNTYPTAMTSTDSGKTYCPTAPTADPDYCIKPSNADTFNYSTNPTDGFVILASKGNSTYSVTKDTSPTAWITVGSQAWAAKNLNIGTRIAGTTASTDNSVIEKYCYNNDEANCTTYGAFYQWDEAMQYVTTEGAQGICPAGSHIPTDNEWKTLEMSLSGMTQATADTTGWRGTDEGTKLKSGGASGLNVPLAGYRSTAGLFGGLSSDAYLWSSSESSSSAWLRLLFSGSATVIRYSYGKALGFSVRCLGD